MRRGAGANWRLIAAAVVAALAAGLLPALGGAVTTGTPRPRAAALRGQQAALAQREHATLLDLYALEIRLAHARGALEGLRARSVELTRARDLARRRAAVVRHSLATARQRLAQTLRTLYRQAQLDPIAILLGATSIDQAVEGIDGLKRVAHANRRLIDDLRRKGVRLRVLDARLRARNLELDAARRSAEAGVAQVQRAAQARFRTLATLRARRDLTSRQVADLDSLARQAERRSAVLSARPAAVATKTKSKPASAAVAQPTTAESVPKSPVGSRTRTLVVDAVAYHLPGRTASGLPVGAGIVAVDPTVIPLGTRMFVPGYGNAVAADVGSAVKGNIIDLWMPSRAKALAWGRRTVTITIYG